MSDLEDMLTDDATFSSPAVHTPQIGKPIVAKYLRAAMAVLNNPTFRYTGDVVRRSFRGPRVRADDRRHLRQRRGPHRLERRRSHHDVQGDGAPAQRFNHGRGAGWAASCNRRA